MNNYVAQQQYGVNRPIYSMQQPYMGIKGRPVASLEEVRASIIDFDGSIFYFPDLANKRIYTKQINVDGTATLNMYELKELPLEQVPAAQTVDYITREEFEAAIEALRAGALAKPAPKTTISQPLNF